VDCQLPWKSIQHDARASPRRLNTATAEPRNATHRHIRVDDTTATAARRDAMYTKRRAYGDASAAPTSPTSAHQTYHGAFSSHSLQVLPNVPPRARRHNNAAWGGEGREVGVGGRWRRKRVGRTGESNPECRHPQCVDKRGCVGGHSAPATRSATGGGGAASRRNEAGKHPRVVGVNASPGGGASVPEKRRHQEASTTEVTARRATASSDCCRDSAPVRDTTAHRPLR